MGSDFHDKPFDDGTLAKLRIFELYAEEWIPVFLSLREPKFEEVHIFDFFCGPGKDSIGKYGSPLCVLNRLRVYERKGLAGWNKVPIVVHFFDEDSEKVDRLKATIDPGWRIPGVTIDCKVIAFKDALAAYRCVLSNSRLAKLLIIDQYGVEEVSDQVFKELIGFPVTDFIFFLSSSTLHRFRKHPAIKQKIQPVEDSYDIHRAVLEYFRGLVPAGDKVYLSPFSIKKGSNIYGLIFGSRHRLGIHKFLTVAWSADEFAGEANFDIDRGNIKPGEGLLPFDFMRPSKIRKFEEDLEAKLRAGEMKSEDDVARFCIESGMTCGHSSGVLKKLKDAGVIELSLRVPNIRETDAPRPIRLVP